MIPMKFLKAPRLAFLGSSLVLSSLSPLRISMARQFSGAKKHICSVQTMEVAHSTFRVRFCSQESNSCELRWFYHF